MKKSRRHRDRHYVVLSSSRSGPSCPHLGLRDELQGGERDLLDAGRARRRADVQELRDLLTRGDFQQWFINSVFVAAAHRHRRSSSPRPAPMRSRDTASGGGARRSTSSWSPRCSRASSCSSRCSTSSPAWGSSTTLGPRHRLLDDRDPVLRADAEGLLRHDPVRPRGGRPGRRARRLRGVLADRHAALGPGHRRDRVLQLHHRLERVHASRARSWSAAAT